MRQSIKNFLIRISGNAQFQRLLERNVAYSLYLMGIGSGTFPYSSGEKALVDRLKQHVVGDKQPLCVFDVGANEGQFLKLIMESGLTHTGGGLRSTFTALSQVITHIRSFVLSPKSIQIGKSIVHSITLD